MMKDHNNTDDDDDGDDAAADVREVDLAGMQLTSLSALVPMLARLPRLRSLNLSNNKLRGLSPEMASLTRLVTLDVSGNPLDGAGGVLRGVRELTALRHLKADMPSTADEDELLAALPSLVSFNDTTLQTTRPSTAAPYSSHNNDDGDDDTDAQTTTSALPHTTAATQPHVSTAALRDGAERLFAAVAPCVDDADACSSAFAAHVDKVVRELVACTTTTTNEGGEDGAATAAAVCAAMHEGEALRAEARVIDFCFAAAVAASSSRQRGGAVAADSDVGGCVRDDATLAHALAALHAHTMALYARYDAHCRRLAREGHTRVSLMQQDMQHAAREVQSLLAQLRTTATRRTTTQEQSSSPHTRDTNDGCGVHHSSSLLSSSSSSSLSTTDACVLRVPHVLPRPLTLSQLRRLMRDVYASKAAYDARCSRRTDDKDDDDDDDGSSSNSNSSRRSNSSALPSQTMEQHLYTFLAQRYGLASLVREWVVSVVQAVQQYACEDADVAVFAKVLRNEVDEAYVDVHARLRAAVCARVRHYTRSAAPDTRRGTRTTAAAAAASTTTTTSMQQSQAQQKPPPPQQQPQHARRTACGSGKASESQGNGGNGNEDEACVLQQSLPLRVWAAVMHDLYSDVDAQRVCALLHRAASHTLARTHIAASASLSTRRSSPTRRRQQRQQRGALSCEAVLRVLCTFQLAQHERLLAPYVALFAAHDTDHDGVVTRDAFARVVRQLDATLPAHDVDALCARADRGAHNCITFSSGAAVLQTILATLYKRDVLAV